MTLNLFPRPKLEDLKLKKSSKLKTHDYRNSNKNNEQLIAYEKRRRHQVYMKMDYFLAGSTYFDFLSLDTFQIVKYSKYLAQIQTYNSTKQVSTEQLLLPIIMSELELSDILKDYHFSEKAVLKLLRKLSSTSNVNPETKRAHLFYKLVKGVPFSFGLNKSLLNDLKVAKNPSFSREMHAFFETVADNALTRFKTPVITPEILFITMMEARTKNVGRVIRKILQTDANWYLLRYKLIKRVHAQEVSIRTEVELNEQYFAYLLKLNLSEIEFNRLIESELLSLGVEVFRNKIVTEMLNLNLFDALEADIHKSIRATNKRTYST